MRMELHRPCQIGMRAEKTEACEEAIANRQERQCAAAVESMLLGDRSKKLARFESRGSAARRFKRLQK
jgi:hypothetical protein